MLKEIKVLVRSVCTSQACNFQDESQPGLQLVEKLATPLSDIKAVL